ARSNGSICAHQDELCRLSFDWPCNTEDDRQAPGSVPRRASKVLDVPGKRCYPGKQPASCGACGCSSHSEGLKAGVDAGPNCRRLDPSGGLVIIERSNGPRRREEIRAEIFRLVEEYHAAAASPQFVPGASPVPVSGRVFAASDVQNLVDSALDFWLTTGRFNKAFEEKLGSLLGRKHVLTVNSGSSANLVAFATLTSPLLKERALQPGDEVITTSTGFPTTVN